MALNQSVRLYPPLRETLVDLAKITLVGLLLALLGPFGSFAMGFAARLAYWLCLSWAGYFVYRPLIGLAPALAERLDLPEPPFWIAMCVVATVPMALIVWLASGLWAPLRVPDFDRALLHFALVLTIGAAITLLFYVLDRRRPQQTQLIEPAAAEATADAPRQSFFDRLSPGLGTDLLALEMEDHYVRVHTALGSELILLRMRDAVRELATLEGAQVHRSWWVARAAVERVQRDGRNLHLVLRGGLQAPVARNAAAALKQAGWW